MVFVGGGVGVGSNQNLQSCIGSNIVDLKRPLALRTTSTGNNCAHGGIV